MFLHVSALYCILRHLTLHALINATARGVYPYRTECQLGSGKQQEIYNNFVQFAEFGESNFIQTNLREKRKRLSDKNTKMFLHEVYSVILHAEYTVCQLKLVFC